MPLELEKQGVGLSDLLAAVALQSIEDLHSIFPLVGKTLSDDPLVDRKLKREICADWVGAKNYILSEFFADDCEKADIDVEAARDRLRPLIRRGFEAWRAVLKEIEDSYTAKKHLRIVE